VSKNFSAEKIFLFTKQSPVLSNLAIFAASKLIWVLVGLLLVWEIVIKHLAGRSVLAIVVSIFSAWAIQLAVAYLINRERPFRHHHEKPLMELRWNTPSFPSGHTTVSCVMAAAVFAQDPVWGSCFFLVAAAVALGRMAVGVHYVSDVVGGAVLGIGVAVAVSRFVL